MSAAPESNPLLLTFEQITADQRRLVGGKGLALAAMHQDGLPVPPGFVITTKTYHQYHGRTLPASVSTKLTGAFDKLESQRVAVRSSAIAEDGPDASWAGQFATVLDVTRDRLPDAIQTCWDSALSANVAAYAHDNRIAQTDLALGVVVQSMIDSAVAGVVFTKNPVTGNSGELMIEACFGLGELLVQGLVTPDNFVVQRHPLKVISSSHYQQTAYLANQQGNTVELPVAGPNNQKLSTQQVIDLAKLAIKVENYFGSPQDIEWALYQDRFFVVQSRPITT